MYWTSERHEIKKYKKTKGIKSIERVTYKMIYNYSKEARTKMIEYAFNDVIYTIELGHKFMPFIIKNKQLETLNLERDAALALYDSERIGINIDWNYIKESKEKMIKEILSIRKELQKNIGNELDAATFASSSNANKKLFGKKWSMRRIYKSSNIRVPNRKRFHKQKCSKNFKTSSRT